MEKQVVLIDVEREGYSFDQVAKTMTVGELIDYLSQFNSDSEVYLSNDNGYTYGGITGNRIYDDSIIVEEETYHIEIGDGCSGDAMMWGSSKDECIDYIRNCNGTNNKWFNSYIGGVVGVVNDETDEVVYEEKVK